MSVCSSALREADADTRLLPKLSRLLAKDVFNGKVKGVALGATGVGACFGMDPVQSTQGTRKPGTDYDFG